MRLIDADELIEFIEDRYEVTWESDTYEGGIKDACSDMLEKIDNMPTIEPERKKGKWIYTPTEPLGYICSECKRGCCRYNFCPNCGADMRGDQNELN